MVDGLKYLYLPKGLMQSMCLLYVLISIVELLGFMLVMLVGEDTFDRDDVRRSQRFNLIHNKCTCTPQLEAFQLISYLSLAVAIESRVFTFNML